MTTTRANKDRTTTRRARSPPSSPPRTTRRVRTRSPVQVRSRSPSIHHTPSPPTSPASSPVEVERRQTHTPRGLDDYVLTSSKKKEYFLQVMLEGDQKTKNVKIFSSTFLLSCNLIPVFRFHTLFKPLCPAVY